MLRVRFMVGAKVVSVVPSIIPLSYTYATASIEPVAARYIGEGQGPPPVSTAVNTASTVTLEARHFEGVHLPSPLSVSLTESPSLSGDGQLVQLIPLVGLHGDSHRAPLGGAGWGSPSRCRCPLHLTVYRVELEEEPPEELFFGERRMDDAVLCHILNGVGAVIVLHTTAGGAVIDGHIRDGISAVGGDGEGLTAIGCSHPAAGVMKPPSPAVAVMVKTLRGGLLFHRLPPHCQCP